MDSKSNFRFRFHRAKYDPEKLVLPSIVWVGAGHEAFKDGKYKYWGGMIIIGWWDFGLQIGFLNAKEKQDGQ